MIEHSRHRVSVKIAFYNPSKDKVLMTVLPEGGNGLPGGHVEGIENPNDTLRRELREELGLEPSQYGDIERRDFWREKNGNRIILGYTGQLLDEGIITLNPVEVAGIVWVSREDITNGAVSSDAYNDYLLEIL